MKQRAIFLDRDGTIIEEKEYLHLVKDVEFIPGGGPALRRLQDAGFKLIVVTNQSGVGRGYYPLTDVETVHAFLAAELAKDGVAISAFYIAPEAPHQPSRGRKPSPAFLLEARDAFALDLARSYMIGDKLIDLECGWNAGVRQSILVRSGYGAALERENPAALARAWVVDNVAAAAERILREG